MVVCNNTETSASSPIHSEDFDGDIDLTTVENSLRRLSKLVKHIQSVFMMNTLRSFYVAILRKPIPRTVIQ